MSATAAASTSLPLLNSTEKVRWVLLYRQRINPHPLFKFFDASGTLRDVIGRAKEHCDRMNYVFIHVQPFLSVLEEDERRNAIGT